MKAIAAALAATAAVAAGLAAAPGAPRSHDAAVARNLKTFNAIVKELELNYVDSIRPDESFEAAIGGLLMTVDPYTEYFTPEQRESLTTMQTGEYGGIGSYLMERDGSSYISGPYEGSPAHRAGLRAGDRIVRIDTVDVDRKPTATVSKLLRGQAGTPVSVRVVRPYVADSIIDVTMERAKLHIPAVPYWGMLSDGATGYIALTSYIEKSAQEMRAAIDSLRARPGFSRLVLDLRGNGGGLVESAVDILGDFLPKGTEVLRTRGKSKSSEKIYKTTHSPLLPDMPLIVLIDGGSASAAEITAGAMQDLDRAVLIGSRSYGKGLVQTTRPLPFDGLLKVTVAKYYIPTGRSIQALDYSHRNADGTVARTPDSLTNVYRTRAGREVRDGGGLTPDIEVKWPVPSDLLSNLASKFKIFDYATRYTATHPTLPAPGEFEVTDSLFDDFVQSVDTASFRYDRRMDRLIGMMRDVLREEAYDSVAAAAVDSLQRLADRPLSRDMRAHRAEIAGYLGEHLAERYHHNRGLYTERLKTDPAVLRALEIFATPGEYGRLLAAPPRKKEK